MLKWLEKKVYSAQLILCNNLVNFMNSFVILLTASHIPNFQVIDIDAIADDETFQIYVLKLASFFSLSMQFNSQQITTIEQALILFNTVLSGALQRVVVLDFSMTFNNISVLNIFAYQWGNLTALMNSSTAGTGSPISSEIDSITEDITSIIIIIQSIGK